MNCCVCCVCCVILFVKELIYLNQYPPLITKLRYRKDKNDIVEILVKMPQQAKEYITDNNIRWCKVSVNGNEINIKLCE